MWILQCALQVRQDRTKTPSIEDVLTQFKSELKIGGIPYNTFQRVGDDDFCALGFGALQLLRSFAIQFICRIVRGKKLLVRSNLPFEAFDLQIRSLSN